MSLCLCVIDKGGKKIHITADSRGSTNINNQTYKLHDNLQKIFKIDNNIIFCAGRDDLINTMINQYRIAKDKSIKQLFTLAKTVASDIDGIQVAVATFVSGKGMVYLYETHKPTRIQYIYADDKKEAKIAFGTGSQKAMPILQQQYRQTEDYTQLLNEIYNQCSDETVGGTMTYYTMTPVKIIKTESIIIDQQPIRQVPSGHYIHAKDGQVLIDGHNNYIDFGNFDAEGIARLAADLISSKMVVANDAYINDLTVNRLKTLSDDIPIGSYVDHVDIRDNVATWISARVGDRVQVKDAQDRPLYFTDSSKRLVTTENTGIPFYEYVFNEELNKAKFGFMGSGHESFPYIVLGLGSGSGSDDDFSGRGKGYIYKDSDEFVLKYNQRIIGNQRQIKLNDDGILFDVPDGVLETTAKDIVYLADGYLKFEHSSGSYIEITTNGDININSVGNVTINGNRIDLN